MAKIGNIDFTIGEKYPKSYQLYYTQAKLFEIRGINEEFFMLTGINSWGYGTEEELKNAILEAIPKYHAQLEKKKLVIAYRCRASSVLRMNELGRGSYQGTLKGVSKKIMDFESFSSPYCSIGIDYNIYMEIFNGKENEYFRVDKDHKVASTHTIHYKDREGMTFIDYSEENIEFFESVKKGMQGMVEKMSMFFDLDSEQAQLLIESNIKLLK